MKRNLGLLGVLLACSSTGCQRAAEIGEYRVPHEPSIATPDGPSTTAPVAATTAASSQRMLAAIVPHGGQAWFFKVTGSVDKVDKTAAGFRSLLESVGFDADGNPTWRLPEGWTKEAGNQFRYATLRTADAEVSVSALPLPNGEASADYVLSNVNRWRDQLQLAPIKKDQLQESTESMAIAGQSAVLVDITGKGAGSAAPRGPFQPPGPAAPVAAAATPRSTGDRRTQAGDLSLTAPEGWQEGRKGGFRLASYTIEQDGRTAEVTVIALGPAPGSVLANVNRWRGQVNLPPIDKDELAKRIKPLEIDGTASQLIHIDEPGQGGRQAISAVIIPRPDRTLFIKMKGPSELVRKQTTAFERFARSIRFASQ